MTPRAARPTFMLTLQSTCGCNPIRSLRALLKTALRRHGMRAVNVRELSPKSPKSVAKTDVPPARRHLKLQTKKEMEMAKRDDVFPDKYLKAEHLGGKPFKVTIEAAPLQPLKNPQSGEESMKTVLYFRGSKKVLPLNRTNWDSVANICGDDSDDWPGKQIELYPDRTPLGGKTVDCIRIRPAGEKKSTAAAKAPSAEDMNDEIPF